MRCFKQMICSCLECPELLIRTTKKEDLCGFMEKPIKDTSTIPDWCPLDEC